MRKYGTDGNVAPLATSSCASVPDGYLPLSGVSISFMDNTGSVLTTLQTDACGNFQGSVPDGVVSVSATPSGGKTIQQPVSTFQATSPAVISALPSAAQLIISVMQDLGNGLVALTVTDSVTGKPVLGLSQSNFSFKLNNNALNSTSVTYGASTAQKASVSVVLDASGSMDSLVGTTKKTRTQLASYATHILLDGLASGGNEAGIVIFDSKVTTLNNASLATTAFKWANNSGTASANPYTVSSSGMTDQISLLRPLADLYNEYSTIYYSNRNSTSADAVHASTGTLRLLGSYYWGGGTAFYNGLSAGVTQIKAGSNPRKIVVAMTDGQDTSSSKSKTTVIQEARTAGVPLYTIGFGSASEVDETSMQDIAQQTGGEYKRVEGTDLTGLFQSVQIGIRFQYVSQFSGTLQSGATLSATVTAGSDTVTRQLTLQ